MFLANSLKEKLKKSYLEGDADTMGNAKFHYEPQPKDPRVLVSYKENMKLNPTALSSSWNYTSQQLQSLDNKEWENTFTLNRLHDKWTGKVELDFEHNFKKFTNDAIYPRAFPAKEFVKDLTDPDMLELKQKRWNISTNAIEAMKPELKKTLFEVGHGLKDFKIVPIKEQVVNPGVDSRDHLEIDGKTWNTSHLFDEKNFKAQGVDDLANAQDNSVKYWKENEDNRDEEKAFPVSEDRKKLEVMRFFKKYRSPYQRSIDLYNTMDKVQKMSFIEREDAEKKVRYKNPGLERYPEKIKALVRKELSQTYQNKYNELIGNLSKEELKKKQRGENRFKWNDIDLVNKITAINSLSNSGILNQGTEKNSPTNRLCKSQVRARKNILLPLVIKGTDINNEEEKIKEKIEEEYKKQQKRQLLLDAKTFKKQKTGESFESKYPLSLEQYNWNKKIEAKMRTDLSKRDEDELYKKIKLLTATNDKLNAEVTTSLLNEISQKSKCDPHFLEAYSRVAGRELERINIADKKNKENLTVTYSHPGTYREFTFIEKVRKPKVINEGIDPIPDIGDDFTNKKVTSKFWSCCMNSDPNSPGCQKTVVKNFKWLYD